jgi:hypothetical protein
MNYNSFTNKDYEIYNINATSDYYNPPLINNKINNFFNDIINKNDQPMMESIITKSNYTWNKFYCDYIEHNLLFIVILIGVVIFCIIRYYSMDLDPGIKNNKKKYKKHNYDTDTDTDTDSDEYVKKNSKILRRKYKLKLDKYKEELYNEKRKILNIIDELSNINYENNINTTYSQHKNDQLENLQQKTNSYRDSYESDKNPLDYTIKNSDMDDNSSYYKIKNDSDQKPGDVIKGIYIEPPYN